MIKTLNQSIKMDRVKFKVPKSVQQAVPIRTIWPDGIFQVEGKFSKTFRFTDINYSIASKQDKTEMFLDYSELLNALDSGCSAKITLNNRRINKEEFEQSLLIPLKGDGLDDYRKEYNEMLLSKVSGTNNSICQERYLTVSVHKKNIDEARTYFARVGHTTFNVVCTLVWLPLIPIMVKIVMWIVRGDDTKVAVAYAPKYLDDRMFGQPMAAMYLISNEIERLSIYTNSMLAALKDSITRKGKARVQEDFRESCNIVKQLQESIGTYIATLFTRGTLTESQAEQTAGLLAVTNSISRIADRCQDVEDSYEQILRDGKKLSNKAKDEIADSIEKVAHLFSHAMKSIAEGDASVAEQLTKDKDKMRKVQKKNKKAHLKRVEKKTCNPELTGNYFNMLYNIDRLADNCTSIMEEAMDHVAYVKLEETGMEKYLEEVRVNE